MEKFENSLQGSRLRLVVAKNPRISYNLEGMNRCSQCGLPKPESDFHEDSKKRSKKRSTCAECRSKAYFKRRYPIPCASCKEHRRLAFNGVCVECLESQGLRVCKTCNNMLLKHLHFYGHRQVCTACLNMKLKQKSLEIPQHFDPVLEKVVESMRARGLLPAVASHSQAEVVDGAVPDQSE